ncbi:RagB/SusD family nutrient uptake outer membrane protein [Polaribacter cellanae]|uniref:RagB/SusD family nutrient uptake outer membrane protein n=1 Tax=Polaribacter cellanae TaxID=2818493 RepID=A0A975H5X4_9FLAO|nr:RagB/SusD family nutrient uptake outer membrane protein [Polaribacter cellanae]QTE21329.1 RagB/SusD family nutrient uptake outer membrane protein [Polaribacter cellanae]
MKKYLKNIIGILGCILIISCSNYLDVQPEDKYLEEDVFSSEAGIQTALNGIYSNMANNNTYGSNLTMSTLDVLGQRYNVADKIHPWHYYAKYNYEDNLVRATFDKIWTSQYTNILNINNFIKSIDTYKGVISAENERILKGEAIGLRAMLHLDLLRLYGPIYSTNAKDLAIPYYTEAKASLSPLLTATEVIANILNDLDIAEKLLENDPVRKYGKIIVPQFDEESDFKGTDFYRHRNLRLNYFAVKALQARANLYAGNNQAALKAAKTVIDKATEWFPWTNPLDIISAGANPDRTFSSEVLFAIQNNNLYNNQRVLFSSSLENSKILAPQNSRLNVEVFENNQNDYRYNSTWALPAVGDKQYKTFFKFADVENKKKDFRFRQPLIRISEMYYIAAETEQNSSIALTYLNTVRLNRGLVNLASGVDIADEIQKEYQKEFYGEGQLFFYYKRKNIKSIPNGSLESGTISMGANQYVVPLPLSELDFR